MNYVVDDRYYVNVFHCQEFYLKCSPELERFVICREEVHDTFELLLLTPDSVSQNAALIYKM